MLRNRKALLLLVLILSMVVTLSACGKNDKADDEIRIGVLAPMTGAAATYGESTWNAVVLAAEERNSKGGINGKEIKLFLEDTRLDANEGANGATKLIEQDKVHGIIGAVASSVSMAASSVAQRNEVPMISPTSTNEAVTKQGDFIFRACFIDPFQGYVMAKFAIEELGAKTAAVIYDNGNDYTVGLTENFVKAFEEMGGTVTAKETYAANDQNFSAQLTKIRRDEPDVLFLPDYYNVVGLIARQARDMGIQSTFLGGDGWDSPDLAKIAGPSIEGGYFSNHYSPDNKSPIAEHFIDAYRAKHGSTPDALAALAYDAALVLFEAIERADSTDGKAIRDAMASISNFEVVSGSITFDENRNPVKSAVVLQVDNVHKNSDDEWEAEQKFIKMVNP